MATNPETNLYKKFYSPRKSTRPTIGTATPVRPSAEKATKKETPPSGRVKHVAVKSPSKKELQESLKRKKTEKKLKKPMTAEMEKQLRRAAKGKIDVQTGSAQKGKAKGVVIKEPTEEKQPEKIVKDASSEDSETEEEFISPPPRKKTRMAKSSEGSQIPDQVRKWFTTDEQASHFVQKYLSKSVGPLKHLNFEDLLKTNLSCIQLLIDQGLKKFLEFNHEVYPDLVKVFYCNLTISDGMIKSRVKGTKIKVTEEQLKEYFEFSEGSELIQDSAALEGYNKFDFYNSLCMPDQIPSKRLEVFKSGPLTADDRLLHYLLTYMITPRGTNHAILTTNDLTMMAVIKKRVRMSWATQFGSHMLKSRILTQLPFGFHVSFLIKKAGVNLEGESVLKVKETTSVIDRSHLGRLDLGWIEKTKSFGYVTSPSEKIKKDKPKETVEQSVKQSLLQILNSKIDALLQLGEANKKMIVENEQRNEERFAILNDKFDELKKLLTGHSEADSEDQFDISVEDTTEEQTIKEGKENVSVEEIQEEELENKAETVIEDQVEAVVEDLEKKTEDEVIELVEEPAVELVEEQTEKPSEQPTEQITAESTEVSSEEIVRKVLAELSIPIGPAPSLDDLD